VFESHWAHDHRKGRRAQVAGKGENEIVSSQIELLADLQIVDQRLREKRRSIDESEARLKDLQESLVRQKAVAAECRAGLEALTAKQKDLEEKLGANEARVKDRRMRIGRIRNDKELQMTKRELDLLKEECGDFETELITVMEQAEAATKRLQVVDAELAQLNTAMATEAGELRARAAALKGEIIQDAQEREVLVVTVPADLRRRYEMIFERRGGLAVVEIRGGVCQGCRINVPPQLANIVRRAEQVNLCPNCQRIIYFRPEPQESVG
jgi:uncharacterized protein